MQQDATPKGKSHSLKAIQISRSEILMEDILVYNTVWFYMKRDHIESGQFDVVTTILSHS
jgi:hypothetical protein